VIEHGNIDLGVDQGRVQTNGRLDLRDLDRIPFSVGPTITALRLETIAPIFGMEKQPFTGPLSLTGQLQGRTGSRQELLTSLFGNLEIGMGPGRVTDAGRTGDLIFKIFSMTSMRGLFSGSIVDDLSGQGLSFDQIKGQNAFNKGIMALKGYHLRSDAMMMDAQGDINLIDEELDLVIVWEPFRCVGTAMGSLPLVGKAAEDLAKIYRVIKGLFEEPEIRPATTNKIDEAVKSGVKASGTIFNDVVNGLKEN
jgi:uncharacterized protein YhdP